MRDLLVVVLEVEPVQVRAELADVDRPGELVRDVVVQRGQDLVADATVAPARSVGAHAHLPWA